MEKSYSFTGKVITHPALADYRPVEPWHRQLEKAPEPGIMEKNLHVLFRARFDRTGGRTYMMVSADDYFKLFINGRFVTQGPAPGFTFRYYYMKVDITDYLVPGENVAAFHTYYQGLINRVWCSGDDRHMLIFDIVSDGRVIASSDGNVKCALHGAYSEMGTFGYKTQFAECIDSRARETGFERVGFDDSYWQNAALHKYADYTFVEQPTRPLEFEKIAPVSVKRTADSLIVDFGREYVGYPYFTATGENGGEIRIFCAQELFPDGNLRYRLRANCNYEEKFILSGRNDEFRQYDYMAFRYMQLELPEGCEVDDISLIARHYPFELRRECAYDDPDIVRIWNFCADSLRYGVQEVIQDCMEREKGQYLGDGSYTSTALAILTGDTSIMEKLITNALDTSFITPTLMTCSPCSFMQEIAEYVLMLPELMLAQIKLSGSLDFARENYERAAAVLDAYRSEYEREDHLLYDLDKWCVVDWPQEARDGYDFDLTEGRVAKGTHNVINAYYICAIKALNKIASLLGLPEYRRTDELEAAYRAVFFDEERRLFRDAPKSSHSALPSNAMALAVGLCPDSETKANIIDMIRTKPVSASAFFMTFASLAGLKREGRDDLVIELIKNDGRWLNMLREGATATYEAWGRDSKWNTSLFHLCYTFAVIFLCDWGIDELFI